ncbi:hypothetical protein ACVWXN_004030 [Bradyrhizobium sp. i1.4.4]
MKALLGEAGKGRFEDLLPPTFALLVADLGHFGRP